MVAINAFQQAIRRPNRAKTSDIGRDARKVRSERDGGISDFKRAVRVLGNRAVDRRRSVGRALAGWRDELIADLGGDTAISTQQRAGDVQRDTSSRRRVDGRQRLGGLTPP